MQTMSFVWWQQSLLSLSQKDLGCVHLACYQLPVCMQETSRSSRDLKDFVRIHARRMNDDQNNEENDSVMEWKQFSFSL